MNKKQTQTNKKRMVTKMLMGIAFLVIAVAATLLITSGFFLKPHYLEPWQKSYAQQFDDPRIQLASHGLLAANGHNMQPWKIALDADENVFYLYADGEKLTPEVDPLARQTMVSQGTFLEYVRVAGEQLGYETDIVLFPDGEYDEQNLVESMKIKPVAKITLSRGDSVDAPLYDYMFLADTNRAVYEDTPLTETQVKQLQAANSDLDTALTLYLDDDNKERLGDYAVEGAEIEAGIHRIYEETAVIFRPNEYQKNEYRYGYSVEGQATTGAMKHVMQGLITVFPALNSEEASAKMFVDGTKAVVEHTPAYGMIVTEGNGRIQQVESGILYARLILTAHSLGLVMHPPSQVLEEYPEMNEPYNRIHSEYAPDGGTIQMFFRIGTATQEYPQTMRRDVMDLVTSETTSSTTASIGD